MSLARRQRLRRQKHLPPLCSIATPPSSASLTKRQPTQGVGILLICDDLFIPRLRKLQDKDALPLHHAFHVSDQDFNRNLDAEEQLQQQFIWRYLRPRLNGKPRRQMFPPFSRERMLTLPCAQRFIVKPLRLKSHFLSDRYV